MRVYRGRKRSTSQGEEGAMPDTPGAPPVSDEELERPDENDPGEVATSFPTIGVGWSGRDKQDENDRSE